MLFLPTLGDASLSTDIIEVFSLTRHLVYSDNMHPFQIVFFQHGCMCLKFPWSFHVLLGHFNIGWISFYSPSKGAILVASTINTMNKATRKIHVQVFVWM